MYITWYCLLFCLKSRILYSKINWKHRAEPTQSTTADCELCSADFLTSISYLSLRCQSSNSKHLPIAQARGKTPCVKQKNAENPNTSVVTSIKLSEYPFYVFVITTFYEELTYNQPIFLLVFANLLLMDSAANRNCLSQCAYHMLILFLIK